MMPKQQPTMTRMPKQMPGESDRAFEKRYMSALFGEDIRTKGDLRDWKPGITFHFSTRDPVSG